MFDDEMLNRIFKERYEDIEENIQREYHYKIKQIKVNIHNIILTCKVIVIFVISSGIPINMIVDDNKQVDNKDEALKIVLDVIENYPDSVNDYRNGKENAIKFLMGMVMKNSKGKINPSLAMEILRDNLNK